MGWQRNHCYLAFTSECNEIYIIIILTTDEAKISKDQKMLKLRTTELLCLYFTYIYFFISDPILFEQYLDTLIYLYIIVIRINTLR